MTTTEKAFLEFRDQLRRFIAKRLSDPEEIDDILQEVFVRVVHNEQTLKIASTPLAWLYTVTRSVLIDHYRQTNKTSPLVTDGMVIENLPAPPEYSEAVFDRCLSPLINNLPDKYREAVKFVDMDGGKQTELAVQIRASNSTAKSRVQRGRKMLKDAILHCCRVELDSLSNVVALDHNNNSQKNCC